MTAPDFLMVSYEDCDGAHGVGVSTAVAARG